MEQNLSFEIIDILLREHLHAREIAARLGTNHTAVLRRTKELVGENILDASSEGRNKAFFIKSTVEARNFVLMTELYKLTKLLKTYPELRRIVQQLQQNRRVKLAVIFGSYAKKEASKKSDIDLFVETQSRRLRKEIENIDSRLSVKIGSYDKENNLIKEIDRTHVVIKGIEDFFEKRAFPDQAEQTRNFETRFTEHRH